jgi:hypothetical protein
MGLGAAGTSSTNVPTSLSLSAAFVNGRSTSEPGRIHSNPKVTGWSPSSAHPKLGGVNPDGSQALETVKLDGTGLRQITPTGMLPDFGGGDWSPPVLARW